MRAAIILSIILLVFGLSSAVHGDTSVTLSAYYANFDSPVIPPEFTGSRVLHSVDGFAGLGPSGRQFGGNLLQNVSGNILNENPPHATVFTLSNLPAHTSVSINFLLGVLNTWDGNEDYLTCRVNGVQVFRNTFAFDSAARQTYYTGALTGRNAQGFWNNYGFDNSWGDSAYNLYLASEFHNIPHTSSTLTVEWFTQAGFNGADNESFGVDQFEVLLHGAIPEPSSAMLVLILPTLHIVRKSR